MNAEKQRLEENKSTPQPWRIWGPYLSDRQWGTVREDYSPDGDAWRYFPHDHARSRAYRWGEDGIGGFCDEEQRLCLSLALWNGRDPIIKERFFGLNNLEGNHGEDVKELFWYLDATPAHTYLKMLYKYPQEAYPYDEIVQENSRRGRDQPEYEVLDTGVFNDNRYFDVFIEYAKAGPEDILLRVTAHNRGPDAAEIHLLPQIWYRNIWSWDKRRKRPVISREGSNGLICRRANGTTHRLIVDGQPQFLFCDNDTNYPRLYGTGSPPTNPAPGPTFYYKDGINEFLVHGNSAAVNPNQTGTKCAVYYRATIDAGGSLTARLRLTAVATSAASASPAASVTLDEAPPRGDVAQYPECSTFGSKYAPHSFADFDAIVARRLAEADEFYADHQKEIADPDARLIQRQAFAGMIWTKQLYRFDIPLWLEGDPAQPTPPPERKQGRNHEWTHLNNAEVISMPAKWEYPWYAAWDLAFHMLPFAHIDAEFAKEQLVLLAREWYMHPNGQFPAYEWNFGDVNPPVHAWAAWRVFQIDRRRNRHDCGDLVFLERVFHKLLLNFTWWVNRKDAHGRNIFQGGFLGLDNIGVFDRNSQMPDGGYLSQADATSWMAMYSLNLMRIALELALHNRVYEDIATKFFEHFLNIASAMTNMCGTTSGLWDEQDSFYYDALTFPDGREELLRIRSIVGLIPMFAVETLEPELLAKLPEFNQRLQWFLDYRPDLAGLVSQWHEPGRGDRRLLSLLRGHRLKQLLRRMLDESEFLSDFGVRSLSKYHLEHPYVFRCDGQELTVRYTPGESDSPMFGGNSNWRGPIWFPINYLIIESLQKFHHYFGDDFLVECPTGSGRMVTLLEVSKELSRRLTRLFSKDESGRRPVFGSNAQQWGDPFFRDQLHFFEYFHGDTGQGLGASHQTGWTALIGKLLTPRRPEKSRESTECGEGEKAK